MMIKISTNYISSLLPSNLVHIQKNNSWENPLYLFNSVGMLEDTLESKMLSLTSAPTIFQINYIFILSILWTVVFEMSKHTMYRIIIPLPRDSSGASKEMPMNTHIIPSRNIVVLNASNTCIQEDQFCMTCQYSSFSSQNFYLFQLKKKETITMEESRKADDIWLYCSKRSLQYKIET